MEIFDCHIHVDKGLEDYDLKITNGNIIFNDIDLYKKHSKSYSKFYQTLIFDYKNNFEFVKNEIESSRIAAIKIHSRLQQLHERDYNNLIAALKNLNRNIPIIYDAFYFGDEMDYQPSLKGLLSLIHHFPDRKVIVAHAGGYNILNYFFHLRGLKNVGYDLSLTIQYLYDTSCYHDILKLIKYTPKEQLFFGSDFHFASPNFQHQKLLEMCKTLNLEDKEIEGIMCGNWTSFL
jgi:predicted TIM-barrel fold metal-dependent hydrolase